MVVENLEIFTYKKFYKMLAYDDAKEFIERCRKLPFKPKFIVTWDKPCGETSRKINEWYNEEQFIGYINKYWLCQIEFEREEDVVAFKLRWM